MNSIRSTEKEIFLLISKEKYFKAAEQCTVVFFWSSAIDREFFTRILQGRQGEYEPGKAQYSTPNIFDQLFLIRAYWNPKSRQGPGLGGFASRSGPVLIDIN